MLITQKGLSYFTESQFVLDKVPVKRDMEQLEENTHVNVHLHGCSFLLLWISSILIQLSGVQIFLLQINSLLSPKNINLSIDVPPFVIKWNYWNLFRILYYSTFTVTMGVGSVPWELMFWVWDTLLFLVISIEHLPCEAWRLHDWPVVLPVF